MVSLSPDPLPLTPLPGTLLAGLPRVAGHEVYRRREIRWSSSGLAAHSLCGAGLRLRDSYAAATSRLRDASLRGPAGKRDKGVANRGSGVTTVTPRCAGFAVPLATLPHWQSRIYTPAGEFPASAAASRITGPAGVALPASVLGAG